MGIHIEVLEKYKEITVYELMDYFDLEYKNISIHDLVNLRKLILKVRKLNDADIYKLKCKDFMKKYPFFILTQTSTSQYLLFLELITGIRNVNNLE